MPASPPLSLEFFAGGAAAACATFFTNPFDVVKTRFQLQGELMMRGQYIPTYRNIPHAVYLIGRHDGIVAIQKGLVAHLLYQILVNGSRLGVYQICVNNGLTKNAEGQTTYGRTLLWGALCGTLGGWISCPFYMIKTRVQARAVQEIAVGFQHDGHHTIADAVRTILRESGVRGLWRGWDGAILRVTSCSAAQLSTFSSVKAYIERNGYVSAGFQSTAVSSIIAGAVCSVAMTPFDMAATRLMNQPNIVIGESASETSAARCIRPATYANAIDCLVKVWRSEGLHGMYKGLAPVFFRITPHSIISLTIWDQIRMLYFTKVARNSKFEGTG